MRSVYVNNKKLSARLLVPKVEDMDSASVIIFYIDEEASAKYMLDVFYHVSRRGMRCWVFIDDSASEDFYNAVVMLFSCTSAKLLYGEKELMDELEDDINEYTQFSVEECVFQTARNYNIDPVYANYVLVPVERALKEHSVYVVMKTLLGMFEAKERNFTKFNERLQYFLEVFNYAANADEVFKDKRSQCLSVLAAVRQGYIGDWKKFERFTMSVMLRPYAVGDTPEKRAEVVKRTIKEAR